jgi:hypothetical protein
LSLIPRRPFRRRRDGRFEVNLSADQRDFLRSFLDQLRDLLMADDPNLRRLFPVAYADDAEQDAAYQQLVHGQLIEARFAAIETVEATLDATDVDEAQLTGWMQSINALRLVLGTVLDVGEEPLQLDPGDPGFEPYVLYEELGWLLGHIVVALSEALPDVPADPAGTEGPG